MHLFNSLCLVFPSHCHLKLGSPWIGMTRICVYTTKPYYSTRTTSRMGLEYHQPALSSLFLSLYKLLIIWTEQLLFPPPLKGQGSNWGIGCVWWMGIPIMTEIRIPLNQIVECPWIPGDSLNEMWASASQFILMLIHEGVPTLPK